MSSEQALEVVQLDKSVRKYWRIKVPKRIAAGATEAVFEVGGERWGVALDRYGRVYVPTALRKDVEKSKSVAIKREGKVVVLKPRPF
ncbi:MAG: hypothetical protein N3H32_04405 [Nitrososphaeria archaeon]|nr:hypothetical protein [Nitrososphaeria archaeon]MDW8043715.1 hypothetical protein [Nitrososphaerota archaeon]